MRSDVGPRMGLFTVCCVHTSTTTTHSLSLYVNATDAMRWNQKQKLSTRRIKSLLKVRTEKARVYLLCVVCVSLSVYKTFINHTMWILFIIIFCRSLEKAACCCTHTLHTHRQRIMLHRNGFENIHTYNPSCVRYDVHTCASLVLSLLCR